MSRSKIDKHEDPDDPGSEAYALRKMKELGLDEFMEEEEFNFREILDDPDAAWRKKDPTPKQIARLKEYGIKLPKKATRGEASLIIDKIKAGKIKKPAGCMFYIKWLIFLIFMIGLGITLIVAFMQ